MHHGPGEPDDDAIRRTVSQQGTGAGGDAWVAWLLDWYRRSLGR